MPNLCRSYPQAADRWSHEASAVVYGDPGGQTGEDPVGTQDNAPTRDAGATDPWRQLTELILTGQASTEARFDRLEIRFERLESRVANVEADVADLKSGLAENNTRLDRMELANERRDRRIDAKFERLAGLIATRDTRPRQSRPNEF
jgi:uncharacterized coiled-coil protein SlyX